MTDHIDLEEEEHLTPSANATVPLLPPSDFPTSARDTARCIIHIDLDAFYAQVEHVRLNIPRDIPLGVQQWQGLIAVNYPARAAGITRHLPAPEARKVCPNLRTVHVATYGPDDLQPSYYEAPSLVTHKVSLEPYRRASVKIFQIFTRELKTFGEGGIVQKASIDEAFLDVTAVVQKMVEAHLADGTHSAEEGVVWEDLGILHGAAEAASSSQGRIVTHGLHDLRLRFAAQIAKHLRATVYNELGYTCSAGVAHNKMLAKLCSGLNKPNKQTVMRLEATLPFLRELPFSKIRMLGGKLGDRIEKLVQCEKAGDIWKFEKAELTAMLGDAAGTWLYRLVRGQCDEEVTARTVTKSMMAAKSFRPNVGSMQELDVWFRILSTELYNRITDDYEAHQRWPKNFKLSYLLPGQASRSRQTAFLPRSHVTSRDAIVHLAKTMFNTEVQHGNRALFPMINLALGVERFESTELSAADLDPGGLTQMQRWLQSAAKAAEIKPLIEPPCKSVPTSSDAKPVSASPNKPFFSKRSSVPAASPVKNGPLEINLIDDDDDQEVSTASGPDYFFRCNHSGCRFHLVFPAQEKGVTYDEVLQKLCRERTEHMDWHAAVKLSNEGLNEPLSKPMAVKRKRSKEVGRPPTKGPDITHFFR